MEMERIVKKFYDELENGKILGRKCKRCGAVEFPPVLMCNTCGNTETEWCEISGEGELTEFVTVSMVTTVPALQHLMPYGLGIVKIKEGREVNMPVRGISEENQNELKAKLPIKVKAEIVERDDFKIVVWNIVE